jgi:coenzyme F420-reducing hydrogenase alpha subunit
MKNRTIKVDYLARVEGEGALRVKVRNGSVADVKFRIFEPPRFFEAFLRGRKFSEAPDITARICGICPVAYIMSSIHAMENAFGIKIDGPLRDLRRLLYCGEWIESHVLHVYMLHAPDFLGYQDAIQLAKDYPEVVNTALKLKKIGNEIVTLIGGREIHPINVKVGGFFKVPTKKELLSLTDKLKWGRDNAVNMLKLTAGFDFPNFERDYEFVAMSHPDEYPFNEGRLISSRGLDIKINEYEYHFREEHVEHSNALQSVIRDEDNYFVGPLARFNLNYEKLSPLTKEICKETGIQPVIKNPFKSIIVRSAETLWAFDEALRIIENYTQPEKHYVDIIPGSAIGFGCSEAPRGILFHRYRVNSEGLITDAKIVPPTSQNQKTIESDLKHFVNKYLGLSNDELTWKCEQAVRNYDPCISCATHFLKLKIDYE